MRPRIGAHVSAAGGLYKAVENAEKIGAECIQIFGASPRQWRGVLPSKEQVKKFKDAAKLKNLSLDSIYLHASYLVNLSAPNPYNRQQSILSLVDHLKIADMLGVSGVIFHMGSSKGELSAEEGERLTLEGMKQVLKAVPGKSKLIMENSAGGGGKFGSDLKMMGRLIKKIKSERIKVCLDTAHAFEAGLIDEYSPAKIKKLFDDFDQEVGMKNLIALHVNDSKTVFNSHHDRHENIGQGFIGLAGFKNLAKEKRLRNKDWMLEVPGFDNLGPDKKNIEILKSCFK